MFFKNAVYLMALNPVTQLRPHQKPHVEKIWARIVSNCKFSYVDTSKPGLGKTHVALCLGWLMQKLYKTKVAIVAPNKQSLLGDDGWLHWAKQYGVDLSFALTYSQLIARNNNVSHPWLVYDAMNNDYHASPSLDTLCQSGVFVIFDEYHRATRKSGSHKACAAIVRCLKRYSTKCRVGLVSFTPGCLPEHYPQILSMLGIITKTPLYYNQPFTSKYIWDGYGMGELIQACRSAHPNVDLKPYFTVVMNKKRIHMICKEIYDDLIRDAVTFAMTPPDTPFTAERLNMFLETSAADLEMVNEGVRRLRLAVGWNNGQIGDHWDMGGITTGLALIERGKLNSMIKYIKTESKKDKRKKFIVAIGARCLEHQTYVQQQLSKDGIPDDMYRSVLLLRKKNNLWAQLPKDILKMVLGKLKTTIKADIMNGKMKVPDRVGLMRRFQSPNSSSWCMIMTPGTGSESISLHDTHGTCPREILISPDHFHTRVVQTAGRVDRVGVKSNSKVLMIYSKQAAKEASILKAMVKKSRVAKDLMAKDQDDALPSDYPYVIEGERDIALEQMLQAIRDER